MKSILLLGATGAVGKQVLSLALTEPSIDKIYAPTRRPLPTHPKLVNPAIDFENLPAEAEWWKTDAVICALGSTMRLAGSKAAFHKVDYIYVLAAAHLAAKAGTPIFVLNSSLGANQKARSFYLRVKGEIETALQQLNFASLTIVRPALLDAAERIEQRPGELIGLWFSNLLAPLLPARYKAVKVDAVARCLLASALSPKPGLDVLESEAISNSAFVDTT